MDAIDNGRGWRVEIEGVATRECNRLSGVLAVVADILPGTDTWRSVQISPDNPLHPGVVGTLMAAHTYVDGEEEVALSTTHADGLDFAWVHYITNDSGGTEVKSLPLDLEQVRHLQAALSDAGRVLEFRGQIRESRRTGSGAPDFGLIMGKPTLRSIEPMDDAQS